MFPGDICDFCNLMVRKSLEKVQTSHLESPRLNTFDCELCGVKSHNLFTR